MPGDEYTEEDIVVVSVAEAICKIPKVRTVNGTIEEVFSFLQGCNQMITDMGLETRSPTPQDALNWIFSELEILGGEQNFDGLRSKYGSDADVLSALLAGIRRVGAEETN